MIWLVLMGFGFVEGVETVIVLEDRVGVERLTAGRDRSAGLMSGILAGANGDDSPQTSGADKVRTATRQVDH